MTGRWGTGGIDFGARGFHTGICSERAGESPKKALATCEVTMDHRSYSAFKDVSFVGAAPNSPCAYHHASHRGSAAVFPVDQDDGGLVISNRITLNKLTSTCMRDRADPGGPGGSEPDPNRADRSWSWSVVECAPVVGMVRRRSNGGVLKILTVNGQPHVTV